MGKIARKLAKDKSLKLPRLKMGMKKWRADFMGMIGCTCLHGLPNHRTQGSQTKLLTELYRTIKTKHHKQMYMAPQNKIDRAYRIT